MNRVWIVGAGGFGREVLQWSLDAGYGSGDWTFAGFLDDNPAAVAGVPGLAGAVVRPLQSYAPQPGDHLICGIALPRVKKRCVELLLQRGARFLTVVHPTAVVGRDVQIGTGCVLCPGVVTTVDLTVGDFVTLNCGAAIGHDARIGAWSTLNGHCDVTGRVQLGEGVLMGTHAAVIPGIQVGDWAVIGAGSVAMRHVAPETTVVGVPARCLD